MVTGPLTEMLVRNKKLAEGYQVAPDLVNMIAGTRAPRTGVAVLSCSDPRLNSYTLLGIDPNLKATMTRNAGDRVMDSIRTLTTLQTIGQPRTIIVMHRTDCGLNHFHNNGIRKALIELALEEKASIETIKFGEITGGKNRLHPSEFRAEKPM